MRRLLLTATIALTIVGPGVCGQSDVELTATSSVDRSTITVGDRIHYKIEIAYPPGTQVEIPAIGAHLGAFEVKDYEIGEPRKSKDGLMHATYQYVVSTFTTGEYVIPPVMIVYKIEEGLVHKVATDKIDILVKSVKPSETGDIKDLKPVLEIRRRLEWWWWLVIGIGGALAAATAGLWWYRKRQRGTGVVPTKPPYETAMEALEELLGGGLLDSGKTKMFYFNLSEIIRRYIGDRYAFNAIDLTTIELLEHLDTLALGKEIPRLVSEFSLSSDLVKFADYEPAKPETSQVVDQAKSILQETRPAPLAGAGSAA